MKKQALALAIASALVSPCRFCGDRYFGHAIYFGFRGFLRVPARSL